MARRDATLIWLGQYALFFMLSYLAAVLIHIHSYSHQIVSWVYLFQQWWGFDGAHAAVRRLPPAYALYTCALLGLLLFTSAHNWYALPSNMRYVLPAFSLFMLLGRWGARPEVETGILLVCLPLLTVPAVAFLLGSWIA